MNDETHDESETERERLKRLNELALDADGDWSEPYRPGSFGCHELLDRASTLAESVEAQLVSHPACALDAEWYALADRAASALRDLYQKIGAAHLGGEPSETFPTPMTRTR